MIGLLNILRRSGLILTEMSGSQARRIFQTYGVEPANDVAALKQQHRELVRKYHPDAGGSNEAMQEINAAFDVLKSEPAPAPAQASAPYNSKYDQLIAAINNMARTSFNAAAATMWVYDRTGFSSGMPISYAPSMAKRMAELVKYQNPEIVAIVVGTGGDQVKSFYLRGVENAFMTFSAKGGPNEQTAQEIVNAIQSKSRGGWR